MPSAVQRVSCSYQAEPVPKGSQTWDWQERQRRLVWKFKKVAGATEHTLQVTRSTSTILKSRDRCTTCAAWHVPGRSWGSITANRLRLCKRMSMWQTKLSLPS